MNADIPPNLREVVATIGAVLRPCAVDTVVPLGRGSEHWAFEVNGSLIARLGKQADEHMASAVEREVALLRILSGVSPVPVPEVVAADPHNGVTVFRKLEGLSLHERPLPNPLSIAVPLASFVASIHGMTADAIAHLLPRDGVFTRCMSGRGHR